MAKAKFDVQPNLGLIASQLGVDPNAVNLKQQSDGTWLVDTGTSVPIPPAALVTIEAAAVNTAVAAGTPPPVQNDVADVISSS